MTFQATLHDGNTITIEVSGTGPNILLPVNPHPAELPQQFRGSRMVCEDSNVNIGEYERWQRRRQLD